MHLLPRHGMIAVLVAATVLVTSCSTTTEGDTELSLGRCSGDAGCPNGQECVGGSCVSVRPTIYDHIQLASALFRRYNSDAEKEWRATHADLLIGQNIVESLDLRAANPNTRLVTYFTNRYHQLETEAEAWCATRGGDPEDFYLHYREDVQLPGYWQVLVPGYPPGFVPGWNPAWRTGDPPASAATRAESRAFGLYDPSHEPWHLANFSDPKYRAFAKDYIRSMVDGSAWVPNGDPEPADGVMMDHGVFYPRWNEGMISKTDEFYGIALNDNHPYGIAFETFYPELEEYLASVFIKGVDVMPNYGHVWFLSQPDRFSQNVQQVVDWVWGEVWITHRAGSSPISGGNRVVTWEADYDSGIAAIARQTHAGKRRVLGARDLSNGSAGSDRGRLFLLGLYYLVANANTFYSHETVANHRYAGDLWEWQWNPAVTQNIGSPAPVSAGFVDFDGSEGTREHFILYEGPDAYDPSLTVRVLARNFTNGMVLVKMLPRGSVADDRSITTHDLPQEYRAVNGDGTTNAIVSRVALRNNEAVILLNY